MNKKKQVFKLLQSMLLFIKINSAIKKIFNIALIVIIGVSMEAKESQPGDEYRGVVEKIKAKATKGTQTVVLEIDSNTIVRKASPWLLGLNHDFVQNPKVAFDHDNIGPWSGIGFSFTPSTTGQALCISISPEVVKENPRAHTLIKAKLPIERIKGKKIFLSGIVKAESLSKLKKHYHGLKLQILVNCKPKSIYIGKDFVPKTNDWTELSSEAIIPENATNATIYIGLQAASGTVYFDKITIKDEKGENIFSDDFSGYSVTKYPIKLSENCIKLLHDMPLPLNRFGGTDSQWFHWKMSLGPYKKRIPHAINYYKPNYKFRARFGVVEYIQFVRNVDSSAVFTWTLNMRSESAEDHADLAQFLCLDGLADDASLWAKKRAVLGVKKPVQVVIWELGNEHDVHLKSGHIPVDEYIAKAQKSIAQIRAVLPNAKFAALAASAPWANWYKGKVWQNWHRKVLKELGSEIDYIAFHPYFGNGDALDRMSGYINTITKDIREITGSDRIKIYNSEWAKWPIEDKGKPWRDVWYKTHSLVGCLETADWLVRMYKNPSVAAQAYHSFSSGPWGIVYYDKIQRKRYITGIGDLFKLFYHSLGSSVVKSFCSSTDGKTSTFAALAMKRPQGLSVVLVNREEKLSHDIHFKFTDGTYELISITTLTGDKMSDYNTAQEKKIRIVKNKLSSSSPFNVYHMKPKSMTVLQLIRK